MRRRKDASFHHNWMRAESVETTIRRLAKYGYNSIEISYDSVELSPGAPGTKAVKQMLADNGISCYGSISLRFASRDLIHADPAARASSVEYLKQCTQMVADLDGSTMSIVPSDGRQGQGHGLDLADLGGHDAHGVAVQVGHHLVHCLRYSTEPARMAGSAWIRSRPTNIRLIEP